MNDGKERGDVHIHLGIGSLTTMVSICVIAIVLKNLQQKKNEGPVPVTFIQIFKGDTLSYTCGTRCGMIILANCCCR